MKKTKVKKVKRIGRFRAFLRRFLLALLVLVIFIGCIPLAVNVEVVRSTAPRLVTAEEAAEMGDFDYIIVLGCSAAGGKTHPMLQDRIDAAVAVFNTTGTTLLMSGDHEGKYYDEPGVMKRAAMEQGVPEEAIERDSYGLRTYDSIIRALSVYGAKRVLIVSQRYHLYRALYIAEKLGLEAYGVCAREVRYNHQLNRDVREMAARVLAVWDCLQHKEPQYTEKKKGD